jgi:hypothetical protein
MECGDGTEISPRVYGGREKVVGPLAARGVVEGDLDQRPKTAETPANTRHVGVAWIPL